MLIKKDNYKGLEKEFANERSLVSGLVNSKEENINKKLIKYLELVVYELIHPECKIENQLKLLKKLGFNVVLNNKIEEIILKLFEDKLKEFKEKSKYLIDGIIIRHNEIYKCNNEGNPDYVCF